MSGSDYRTTKSDTVRLSASEQDQLAREARQDAARRFLDRKGEDLVAVVLGLAPEMCATGCGGTAVRMGYCMADACQAKLRRAAKVLGDSAYRKARGDAR